MISVLVPADWTIPGAGPIPTTPNKDYAEGRVEPLPTDVGELVAAGMKLPGSLFEAEGTNQAGGRIGVRVGVYDTGEGNPFSLVKEAVGRLTPNAAVSPTNVLGSDAVRTLEREADGSVICDYWARIRAGSKTDPTGFILLRCWRTGPPGKDEEGLFDDIAGSYLAGGPVSFTGPIRRITLTKFGPPDSEVVEQGRFRYAGWRLGSVFHTKMITAREAELATELGVRPRDALLFVVVFFSWLAATLAFVGVGPVLLLGGATAAGTLPQLRSRGPTAVGMLAAILAGLLVLGVATS